MIISFSYRHRVGTVCRFPCKQCRESTDHPGVLYGADGKPTDLVPMLIVREATWEEFRQWAEANKAPGIVVQRAPFYYEVQTD